MTTLTPEPSTTPSPTRPVRGTLAGATSLAALLGLLGLPMVSACGGEEPDDPTDDTAGGDDGSADDTGGLPDDPDAVWEEIGLESAETVQGIHASTAGVYVATTGGQVWQRQGGSWSQMDIDVDDADLNSLWGVGTGEEMTLVVAGDEGFVASWAAGAGFTVEDLGTPNHESLAGPGVGNLYVAGWGGLYGNQSGAWEFVDIGTNLRLNNIWYDGSTGIAVGEDGALATYAAGTWTVQEAPTLRALFGVTSVGGELWIVGERGTVLRGSPGSFEEIDLGTESSLWAVAAASPSEIYVVGSNGKAWRTDGTDWTELPTGVDNNLYSITISADGKVFAGGNRGALLRLSE